MSLTTSQQKALQYNKHISLTANAGSGKTFVLIQRFLKILTEENISIRNIAAITFTEKAASELYTKIAQKLDEAILSATDAGHVGKLETLRKQLISSNISTIHSFCIDILREFPIEAGIDANFITIDTRRAQELLQLSVKEVLKEKGETEAYRYVIRLLGGTVNFEDEMQRLIQHREKISSLRNTIYAGDDILIAENIHKRLHAVIDELFTQYREDFLQSLSTINSFVLQTAKKTDKANIVASILEKLQKQDRFDIALLQVVKDEILNKDYSIKKIGYLKNGEHLSKEEDVVYNYYKLLDIHLKSLESGEKEIETSLAVCITYLLEIIEDIDTIYTNRKTENGYLDFEDLMIYAKELLEIEHVREALAKRFQYIMIDEYQDTNELQYEIFLPLLDRLKRGNLFVVGDEKQSIYMFREAEVGIFSRTKSDIILESGKESDLVLPDSFRMTPEICLFTNKLFSSVFHNPKERFNEVAHTDLVCAKQNDFDSTIEIILFNEEAAETMISEAEMVVRRIIQLKKEVPELQWGDIAILCRKRDYFSHFQSILPKYKIPFIIAGGRGFYQNQPVYDFYNYLSFLLDNKNDAALVGILRSPFFLIDDTTIFNISCLDGESLYEKLQQQAGEDERLRQIVLVLQKHNTATHAAYIPRILQSILRDTPYAAILANRVDGEQQSANLEKLMNIALQFELDGYNNLYSFLEFLQNAIDTNSDEGFASVSKNSDAMQLITIHQSKGLEYKAVFMYHAQDAYSTTTFKKGTIYIDRELGVTTKLPEGNNYFDDFAMPAIMELTQYITVRKEIAEAYRLLYVALTRAKNYLFISAETKKDGTVSGNSFIGTIVNHLDIDVTKDTFPIIGEVKFLTVVEDDFIESTKTITMSIPIIQTIDAPVELLSITEKEKPVFTINTGQIQTSKVLPTISATQYVTYMQCPLKYHLQYQLHLDDLIPEPKRIYSTASLTQEAFSGDDSQTPSALQDETFEHTEGLLAPGHAEKRGLVLHALLERGTTDESAGNEIATLLHQISNEAQNEEAISEIAKTYTSFIKSPYYTELLDLGTARKEFDITAMERDYFLQGKIDRIIFDGDRIIIVDYKSNAGTPDKLKKMSRNYAHQLSFYAYVASKLYPEATIFETRLIYLSSPEQSVIQQYTRNDFSAVKENLSNMAAMSVSENFSKTLSHCGECLFSDKRKNCVVR